MIETNVRKLYGWREISIIKLWKCVFSVHNDAAILGDIYKIFDSVAELKKNYRVSSM